MAVYILYNYNRILLVIKCQKTCLFVFYRATVLPFSTPYQIMHFMMSRLSVLLYTYQTKNILNTNNNIDCNDSINDDDE